MEGRSRRGAEQKRPVEEELGCIAGSSRRKNDGKETLGEWKKTKKSKKSVNGIV